jgi:hypothetical protein
MAQDASYLRVRSWSLQKKLMAQCQSRYGRRDVSKRTTPMLASTQMQVNAAVIIIFLFGLTFTSPEQKGGDHPDAAFRPLLPSTCSGIRRFSRSNCKNTLAFVLSLQLLGKQAAWRT